MLQMKYNMEIRIISTQVYWSQYKSNLVRRAPFNNASLSVESPTTKEKLEIKFRTRLTGA